MASAVRAWRSCSRSSAWRSSRETRASARRCSTPEASFGREEREDQVDRLVVDGIEIDGVLQAHEDAAQAREALEARVRRGDAVAHAGGAGLLPLGKGVQHMTRRRGRNCGPRSRRLPPGPCACWPR